MHLEHRVYRGVSRRLAHANEHQLRVHGLAHAQAREPAANGRLNAHGGLCAAHWLHAHSLEPQLVRLLLLDGAHHARALPPLPAALVDLDDADGLVLVEWKEDRRPVLLRHAHLELFYESPEELFALAQLL